MLQPLNYANLLAFLFNVALTFGFSPITGFPDNGELSAKYQTLVTPSGYAFSIWGIIFTAQLIWTVVQMTPAYRGAELVLGGVAWDYVWVCAAQGLWTVMFGMEKMGLSLGAMVMILACLTRIVARTSLTAVNPALGLSGGTGGGYWLLIFPFEIHAAWIMAATLVNTNVVLVAYSLPPIIQLFVAWASLLLLAVLAILATLGRLFVVPVVLAWAAWAIAVELSRPRDAILQQFKADAILRLRKAAAIVAIAVLMGVVVTTVYDKLSGRTQNE